MIADLQTSSVYVWVKQFVSNFIVMAIVKPLNRVRHNPYLHSYDVVFFSFIKLNSKGNHIATKILARVVTLVTIVEVVPFGPRCAPMPVNRTNNSVSAKWFISGAHSRHVCSQMQEDTCIYSHAAIKYQVKVLLLCPGAVIPYITALHTQEPHCLDYRAETYNSIHPSSPPLFWVLSRWECVHT